MSTKDFVEDDEVVASIIQPHFDAVRDIFGAFVVDPEFGPLARLRKTTFVIDPRAHDTERHFAATSDSGMKMILAPDFADLPVETITVILAHEFGHAADFAYPGCWTWPKARASRVSWVGPDAPSRASAYRQNFGRPEAKSQSAGDDAWLSASYVKLWSERNQDQVEWTADAIAETVTGLRPRYCGPCLVQCFDGGIERPKGLR